MVNLNFPTYDFKIRKTDTSIQIFDDIRKKWVALTPEEWVRQHMVTYLIEEKHFPKQLIAVEMPITVNGCSKRCDIVIFDRMASPLIIVECKASTVELSQKTFDQAAVYNLKLNVGFLLITNGIQHFLCKIDTKTKRYVFLKEIPFYNDIVL